MAERTDILQALTNYCEGHIAARHDWRNDYGLSCDELGCPICNGDGAAETAEWWLKAWEEGPQYDEDGYLENPYADLPFDPDDADELAEWLEDEETYTARVAERSWEANTEQRNI